MSDGGIPPGDYKVTFSLQAVAGKGVDPKKKSLKAQETLPDKYVAKEKTDVSAQVSREKTEFKFELSTRSK
jgi:hypothetical protein